MKRTLFIILGVVALTVAGYAAYTLGTRLADSPSSEIMGTAFQNPVDVSAVTLKTAGDKVVSLGDYKGKVTLVFFGFTRCPDVCPITLSRLAKLYDELAQPTKLQVLMISVDPEFDTPDIANAYASGFNSSFLGLSGSNTEVAKAMETFYVGAAGLGTEQYFHTDVVFVLNRDAQMKYLYGQSDMQYLEGNVKTLLSQKNW
jgi:protein SCO1/2